MLHVWSYESTYRRDNRDRWCGIFPFSATRIVSFISRLKTVIFCAFLIVVIAIIAILYYSLRYSYTSKLEIKYMGRLKFEKDFDKSDIASRNSSYASLSTQAIDKVHLLQESSPSNHSYQEIKMVEGVGDLRCGRIQAGIRPRPFHTVGVSLWKLIKCLPFALRWGNLKKEQSPVISHFCVSKARAGEYHDYCEGIVFKKHRF